MGVTLHDAFLVPLHCGEVGIPMAGMDLLASLGPQHGELAARIAAQAHVFRGNGPRVGEQIIEVERILDHYALTLPPRPNSFVEYVYWSNAACKAMLDYAGSDSPAGALGAFSRALGETLQSVATLNTVLYLRAVVPDYEPLWLHDERATLRLAQSVERLDAMSKLAMLPAATMAVADKLASTALLTSSLEAHAREVGLKLVFGRLLDLTRELTALCVS
jgi:hypothetical protein